MRSGAMFLSKIKSYLKLKINYILKTPMISPMFYLKNKQNMKRKKNSVQTQVV